MAGNLVPLDEAAKMLGVSPNELTDMRSRSEVYGYRDGASWKFKMDELERVAGEKGISLGSAGLGAADELSDDLDDLSLTPFDDDLSAGDEDSVLVSEAELGHSQETTSSTIIGKSGAKDVGPDSDLQLVESAGSDLELSSAAAGSDLNLVAGDSDSLAGSDIGAGSEPPTSEPSTDKLLGADGVSIDDDDLELVTESGLTLGDGDLSPDDDDDLQLQSTGSEVELGADIEEDDLVLETGSSDLTLGAGDSGINLSPTDSGLSLEESPIDLGGSSVSSLELPEDDDVIALEEEPTDPDAATQLKADDEFLLTPVEDTDDESSGSQVIALEDSEGYADAEAQTMLGAPAQEEAQPALVAEDAALMQPGIAVQPDAGMAAQPITMPAAPAAPQTLPERPYTIWNILLLLLVFGFLLTSGVFLTDLLRSLWEYDHPNDVSTTIMDTVCDAIAGLGE